LCFDRIETARLEMKIFVSIAAYRDPELVPTIEDCLGKARHPDDLRFGICWQHTDDETLPPDFQGPRFRIIDVPWHESKGACWARAEVMNLWDGEDFFLQLDSHHRFVQDWDARLLRMSELSGVNKPLLTSYGAPFDPAAKGPEAGEPMQMDLDRFSEDGIPMFRPRAIPDWRDLDCPLRARFVSAHFLFAPGSFVTEVPYDPELYFHGEEITLAIRAFTHGYSLLHPQEHVLWHEYTRSYRVKHWDDHLRSQGMAIEWHERDGASRRKVSQFLTAPFIGPFGCGSQRSFAEYEAYAGLNFQDRSAQTEAWRGQEPAAFAAWDLASGREREWHVQIVLHLAALPDSALADPKLWYVGFHDAADAEIYREDLDASELRRLRAVHDGRIVIERRFHSERRPMSWTVWPVNSSGEWLARLTRPVGQALI